MNVGNSEGGRSAVRSRLALVLLVCGLMVGGLWAMTLIGLLLDIVARLLL